MKKIVLTHVEIDVKSVVIDVPVIYGDEEIPYDFPLRYGLKSERWRAVVDVDFGKIENWPEGKGTLSMTIKVCDSGTYTLLDQNGNRLKTIHDYVPNKLIPGEYGDYIKLVINEEGILTNWPKHPSLSDFYESND